MENNVKNGSGQMSIGSIMARFFTSAIVLAVTAFFTPGFEITSLWTLLLAAVVLTVMDYLINMVIGLEASPFGRGVVGFIVSAVILYATQFFVAGYTISWVSAAIGALIYGIVASIMPGKQTMS